MENLINVNNKGMVNTDSVQTDIHCLRYREVSLQLWRRGNSIRFPPAPNYRLTNNLVTDCCRKAK